MTAQSIDSLIGAMSFTEKVGQLNQRLLGWKALTRDGAGRLVVTDELKREIDRWGGLGVLYGLFRADPWSGQHWGNGIRPEERPEAIRLVQEAVLIRSAHGIGALLSEEAPHGHQALGGTILPTNLAMGATFDPEAVRQAQEAVAAELAASGVHIALVSGLDMARDPRWGRCEECFGEDPLMASRMCEAIVAGMQGENRSRVGRGGVAVVLKHLAAQGEAVGGRNGQSAIIGTHDLHEIHLPPVVAGVRAGALGFMAAYNDIDSVPCCASPWLLQEYLRGELGFDGIVMADGLAVDRLVGMAGSIPASGRAALLAGVDVSLWDEGFASLERYADDEAVVAAVDRSLRRVLELKAMFGLLPEGYNAGCDRVPLGSNERIGVGRGSIALPKAEAIAGAIARTRTESRTLAGECLTLLDGAEQWDGIGACLRDDQAGSIIVTGPFADDMACFLGDYTAPLEQTQITSVYRQLRERFGERVLLAVDGTGLDGADWLNAAAVVAVLGGTSERSYDSAFADNGAAAAVAEHGATCGEGVDLCDVTLPWRQDALLDRVRELTDAPLVSVVVSGRAHVLTHVLETSDATLWEGYAGQYGPQAVVDALVGETGMPGRLPVTLPAYAGAVPVRYNDRQSAEHVYRDAEEPVLRPFGFGEGSLSGVRVESFTATAADRTVRVDLRLHGGQEPARGTCIVFARRIGGSRIPRLAQLVAAEHLDVAAGQRLDVRLEVPFDRLMDPDDVTMRVRLWVEDTDARHECEATLTR